jgi:hypothetical protein
MPLDLRAIAKHITPRNVALWVLVLTWAALAVILVIWMGVQAWNSS